MNEKVLIVDDEVNIVELLSYNLEDNGYSVLKAYSGEEALEKIETEQIDLIILDYMMPGIDGIETLRRIRQIPDKDIPVMMLTAKNEEVDAIIGLEMGADDYIGKPFRVRELMSRVKVVLRRYQKSHVKLEKTEDKNIIEIDQIKIDTNTYQIFKEGKEVTATLKEFELLYQLMKYPGKVYSRDELLLNIWGYDYIGESRTVDVHIRQLRKKIESDDKNPELIKTVRGKGYKFKG